MQELHIRKFGLAAGLTGTLLYIGCIILMFAVGHGGTVKFFNTLLHGLDVSSIIRMHVPVWEALLGIIQTFILSWLVGASIAGIYNFTLKQ